MVFCYLIPDKLICIPYDILYIRRIDRIIFGWTTVMVAKRAKTFIPSVPGLEPRSSVVVSCW